MPIRLILADDDPLVRRGILSFLKTAADIEVVAEAGDGEAVLRILDTTPADVILMDLNMPRLDGIEATRRVRQLRDAPEVIALTVWDVDDALIKTIDAGACGFLLKTAPFEDIINAVRAAVTGDSVMSPRSTRQMINHFRQTNSGTERLAAKEAVGQLTERERQVVAEVGLGRSNPEIGQRLHLSAATIKSHLGAIMVKLGVENRVLVGVIADRAGLLPTDLPGGAN